MSTETIVNRTPETAGQAYERQKLEAEEIQGDSSLLNSETRVKGFDAVKDNSIVSDADYRSTIEKLLEKHQSLAQGQQPDTKFREQVIAAFKHLGLDTTKFFN